MGGVPLGTHVGERKRAVLILRTVSERGSVRDAHGVRKVGSNEFGTESRWKHDERARCSLPIAADDGRQQGSISALSANHQDRWSLSARRSAACENRGVHENLLHHVVVRVVRCADEGRVNSLWRRRCWVLRTMTVAVLVDRTAQVVGARARAFRLDRAGRTMAQSSWDVLPGRPSSDTISCGI